MHNLIDLNTDTVKMKWPNSTSLNENFIYHLTFVLSGNPTTTFNSFLCRGIHSMLSTAGLEMGSQTQSYCKLRLVCVGLQRIPISKRKKKRHGKQ